MYAGSFFGDFLGQWLVGGEPQDVGAAIEIDPSRYLLIPAESRIYVVEPESRVLVVPAESRVLIVEAA